MEIEKLLKKIKKRKKNAFLMGDYNTNTLSESNKTIKHVNEFSNILLKFLAQSDHYPIFTLRKETQQPTKQTHIIKRNHN